MTVPGHWRNVHQPMDETRLHAVCFGPLASETYIRRFFIALSVGGGPSSMLLLDGGIAIELLNDVRLSGTAPDVVEDHQPGEHAAVNKHDLGVDLAGVINHLAGECACRNEWVASVRPLLSAERRRSGRKIS